MSSTPTGDARTRAVIYCRISQDRTGAGLGIERQREDCQALAERNGWNVVEVYVDNDISAYSGKKRPGYRRMLADLDEGTATVVIVWHTDRLTRSIVELEEYIDLSERRGIATHTVQAGTVDLATPSGRMTARILGAVARQESEHKGHRVARARQQKALAGEWHGGIRPFGWGVPTGETRVKVDRQTGEEVEVPVLDMNQVVPEEAEALRHWTDTILAGGSIRGLVKWCADKGITSTRGNAVTHTDMRDMLMRPRNAGIAVYRGEEVGRGKWEPIVEEAKYRAVVAILTDPSRTTTPGAQPKWLGSLLYRCGRGECPRFVYVTQSGGRSYPSYRCQDGHGGGRRAEVVDQYVEDTIVSRLSEPDAHELLLPGPDDVDVAALQAEEELIRRRMKDLGGLFGAGELELEPFTEGMDTARAQLAGVTRQLARAATVDPLVALVGAPDVRKAWRALELDRQRTVLRSLVEVTLKTPRPGRMPDGGYFDYDAVVFTWKRGGTTFM
ncbi:recombinase family protein [Streptomyces caniscabiei]|uniref:Recombinase family protein n=1 Tax=Streptomyces caniscabiei TaxID=2746961 RepID=A0ABU4MYU6_9ACTN|nr:recombinase family protein [Streptomyces caniscabiei]MDX2953306.1 recombinase family protein [Streptomyces caniscabiei]MDX2987358.1 recombinase family protein [Streptomyces caniscabiei]MDX3009505.1 recombinase family protein [Streptomyces caniscabiei]MDX3042700.1 recombinase family protein [Streptomyces caniscabiei]